MTIPASESRPGFRRVVIAVWLILVSAIALIDHVALSQLSAEMRPYGSELSLLHERGAELKRQLDSIAGQPNSVSEARFVAAREALDVRIAQLERTIGNAAQRDELAPMQDRLNDVETRLANLRQTRATPASPPRSTRAAATKTPKVAVRPFTVLGIEMRGGEPFLSLAPTGASSLTQVQVLRVGETYGDWRLEKLDSTAAEFLVGRRPIRLELP